MNGCRVALLSSDEQLLKNEASQAIMAEARRSMPGAQLRLYTHSDLRSRQTIEELQQELIEQGGLLLGLADPDPELAAAFSTDRLIKIYLEKIDTSAVAVLTMLVRSLRPGLCVVIDLPRLNTQYKRVKPAPLKEGGRQVTLETQFSRVLAALYHAGGTLDIMYPPEGQQLTRWTAERAARLRLSLPPGGAEYLSQSAEGNLIAIDQALHIAAVMFGGQPMSIDDLTQISAQDSHYTGYELPEAVEGAAALRALNIITTLVSRTGSSETLRTQLPQLDRMLSAIAQARAAGLPRMSQEEREGFFKSARIFTREARSAFMQAVTSMPPWLTRDLIRSTAEAARAGALFDDSTALRALRRLCVCPQSRQAGNLRKL